MGPIDLLAPTPAPRFGSAPDVNAYIELHNLIAAAESTGDFGPADLDRIGRHHGVDLRRAYRDERIALYQALLDHRLANGDLDEEDRRVLAHVARTLHLSAADLRPAHERAFGKAVTDALADDCLDVEERLLLYKLQHLLGLDPRLADGAFEVLARERFLLRVARALCDGELSPDEAAGIEAVRADLSLEVPAPVADMLAAARQRWEVRHGDLPRAHVGLRLLPGETGHFIARGAQWRLVSGPELRNVSQAHRAALRSGETQALRVPEAVFFGRTEGGQAIVTSKRLVLLPSQGVPDDYSLVSLVQTLRFSNGVVIRTKGDRRVFIDVGDDNRAFYTVLYRAMHPGREVPSA